MKIEKGITLPAKNVSHSTRYPFPDMKIGDSFAVPAEKMQAAASAASHYGKVHNQKFASRKNSSGLRIWRTA